MNDCKNYKLNTSVGELSYVHQPGSTQEAVVFLHDLGRNSEDFMPVLGQLTTFDLYLFDTVGFGESGKPANFNYTLNEISNVLFEGITQTKAKKGFQIIANGLGIVLAALLAKQVPHLVLSIIGVGLGSLRATKHNEMMPISANEESFAKTEYPLWISAQKSRGESTKGLERSTSFSYFRTANSLKQYLKSGSFLDIFSNLSLPKYIFYGDLDTDTINSWLDTKVSFSNKYVPLVNDNPILENAEESALLLNILLTQHSLFSKLSE